MAISKPTLKDVAQRAGTSVATASVVINRTPHKFVRDELVRRVLAAAKELQYRPNVAARRMKGKRGRCLAILVPQFENVYFHRIVISAESYANAKDYTVSIFSTHDEEEKELKHIQNLISLGVDGVMISPARYRSKSTALLRQSGIPTVIIDRPVEGEGYDLVTVDYFQGGYQGTRLLIEHGHRRLAYIGWRHEMRSIVERVRGFKAAAEEVGLGTEVEVRECERSRDSACAIAHDLLQKGAYTGIFAGHHQIGEGVIDAARALGKRIPEDFSLVIFGNPAWASIISPRITCVAQQEFEIGTKAALLLIDRLENETHQAAAYILPVELYQRESVGRPAE